MSMWQRINQPWSYDVGTAESDNSYLYNSAGSYQNFSAYSNGYDSDSTTVIFSDNVTTIFGHGNNSAQVWYSNNNTIIDGNGSTYIQVVGGNNNAIVLENGNDIVNNIGAENTLIVTCDITYGYKAIFSDKSVGLWLEDDEYYNNVTQGTDVFTYIYDRYTGAQKATLQFVNGAYIPPTIYGCNSIPEPDDIHDEILYGGGGCEPADADDIHDETPPWQCDDDYDIDEITDEEEPSTGYYADTSPSLNEITPGSEATLAEPYTSSTPNYGSEVAVVEPPTWL